MSFFRSVRSVLPAGLLLLCLSTVVRPQTTLQQIQLAVPRDTPIRIALSSRVRIWREGIPLTGKVTETVYAFDQPVIPVGSEVRGHVTRVAPVSKMRRAMALADADFSPARAYTVMFDTLILSDGRHIPLVTTVAPGTEEVVHLVSGSEHAAAKAKEKEKEKKSAAAQFANREKQEVKDKYHQAVAQIKLPGRMHRVKQFLLAQLPYRRQYLETGTRFDADLVEPLDFGSTTRLPEQLNSMGTNLGTELAPASTVNARLSGEISSATAHRGTPIEAVITVPVFNAQHQLVLAANSRISGEVTHAKPAGKLHHNGELRVVFERVVTPEGVTQTVRGNLEGVQVDRAANLNLDDEGGARVSDSKSRYLSTGLAIGIAFAAARPESDSGAPDGVVDPATKTAAGGSGFKLVGAVVSLAARSKVFSSVLGVYGASMSVYTHFLSRGRDVVLPKDTALEIVLGDHHRAVGGTAGR
jgi:hypothetical protein